MLTYGKGTYSLVADRDGSTENIAFRDVLYLPDLEKNLLSVRAMIKLGASVEFEGDLRRVTRNSKLLAIGEMYVESYPW